MKKPAIFVAATLFVAAFSATATASAQDLKSLSRDEYYGAAYYKQALEDPKIQKIKSESKKLKVIARSIRWGPKKLKAAIAKVEAFDDDPATLAVDKIKEALGATRVKGRVYDVLVNADAPKHVVVYVRWQASARPDVIKEASTIAHTVGEQAPFVSTLSLSAIHPKAERTSKDSVWAAKISHDGMISIKPNRIDDYADRLYKRLFEGIEEKAF